MKDVKQPPAIGAMWPEQGGIFAGIIGGVNGAPDYYLIHTDAEYEIIDVNHATAIQSARAPIYGFDDWHLPDRREARLLTINSPDSFNVVDWYWTSSQYADYIGFAWLHNFSHGHQHDGQKLYKCRARAVRRVPTVK